MEPDVIRCPDCASEHVVKTGFGVIKPGTRKQRYKCRDCGRTFYPEEAEG